MREMQETLVPMRDGVRLATDIMIPDRAGPFPAILTRTPYGKDRFTANSPDCHRGPSNSMIRGGTWCAPMS